MIWGPDTAAVFGGLLLAVYARYIYRHASDRRDFSGGAGSGFDADTRRFIAAFLMVGGFTMSVYGIVR